MQVYALVSTHIHQYAPIFTRIHSYAVGFNARVTVI